jgi:hypothetical protein
VISTSAQKKETDHMYIPNPALSVFRELDLLREYAQNPALQNLARLQQVVSRPAQKASAARESKRAEIHRRFRIMRQDQEFLREMGIKAGAL